MNYNKLRELNEQYDNILPEDYDDCYYDDDDEETIDEEDL